LPHWNHAIEWPICLHRLEPAALKGITKTLQLLAPSKRWLRPLFAAALMTLNSAADAQFLRDANVVKFGTGCSERIQSSEAGLGVCMIGAARSRVWCPNGKVYERDGILPDMSLIRSVCGLNQVR
jgi:hypothetical protein